MQPIRGFTRFATGDAAKLPKELTRLLGDLPFDTADFGGDHTVWFAPASVSVQSLRVPDNTFVIVDGDLDVAELFDDRPLSADPENVRGLVVNGTFRAGSVLLASSASVRGAMCVRDWLIAESDGDYGLKVGGELRARFIVALGHHVEVSGGVVAERKIGYLGLPSDVSKFDMARAFVADLVGSCGGIEIEELAARAIAGEPVFAR